MYPNAELTRLAARKLVLEQDVAVRRAQCQRATSRLLQPATWFDGVLPRWRRLPPLARLGLVTLGLVLKRTIFALPAGRLPSRSRGVEFPGQPGFTP